MVKSTTPLSLPVFLYTSGKKLLRLSLNSNHNHSQHQLSPSLFLRTSCSRCCWIPRKAPRSRHYFYSHFVTGKLRLWKTHSGKNEDLSQAGVFFAELLIRATCPLSHLLPGPCWILLSWLSNNGRATWLLSTGNEWISHGVKSSSRPPNLENKSGNILHVLVNRMADWQSCLLVIRVWQCALW